MFKQGYSLSRQKMIVASINKFYGKMWDGFCLNTEKCSSLKPKEKPDVPLKNGTRDF